MNLRSWIGECEGSECEGSEGESTPECEGSDIGDGYGLIGDGYWLIGDEDGLIGDEMGLSATVHQCQVFFCLGLGSKPSRTVIGVGCRSSREWFVTIGFGFGFRPS